MPNKKILVAGPDFGMEFGWRLMRWQAHVRWRSLQYDETVVLTSDSMWPLYRDFAVQEPTIGTRDRFRFSDVDVDYVLPTKDICKAQGLTQNFVKYGISIPNGVVAIHARDDSRKVMGSRNWPAENWVRLLDLLRPNMHPDRRYVSIGSKEDSMHIPGTTDFRGADMLTLFATLSGADICIGPSSGPMHLASLCGCPHVVWSDLKVWDLGGQKGTNRHRYEKAWNPFGTPVKFIDSEGWQPRPKIVLNNILEFFNEIP